MTVTISAVYVLLFHLETINKKCCLLSSSPIDSVILPTMDVSAVAQSLEQLRAQIRACEKQLDALTNLIPDLLPPYYIEVDEVRHRWHLCPHLRNPITSTPTYTGQLELKDDVPWEEMYIDVGPYISDLVPDEDGYYLTLYDAPRTYPYLVHFLATFQKSGFPQWHTMALTDDAIVFNWPLKITVHIMREDVTSDSEDLEDDLYVPYRVMCTGHGGMLLRHDADDVMKDLASVGLPRSLDVTPFDSSTDSRPAHLVIVTSQGVRSFPIMNSKTNQPIPRSTMTRILGPAASSVKPAYSIPW